MGINTHSKKKDIIGSSKGALFSEPYINPPLQPHMSTCDLCTDLKTALDFYDICKGKYPDLCACIHTFCCDSCSNDNDNPCMNLTSEDDCTDSVDNCIWDSDKQKCKDGYCGIANACSDLKNKEDCWRYGGLYNCTWDDGICSFPQDQVYTTSQ